MYAVTDEFHFQPTDTFEKKLKKIETSDPEGHNRLVGAIKRLLLNPEYSDGKLQGPHRGRLKKYVGHSGYRLIYNWCSSCRKANEHLQNACDFCETIPNNSVVFHDVFSKSEAQRLGY